MNVEEIQKALRRAVVREDTNLARLARKVNMTRVTVANMVEGKAVAISRFIEVAEELGYSVELVKKENTNEQR